MAKNTQNITLSDVFYDMGITLPYRPEPIDINYSPVDANRYNATPGETNLAQNTNIQELDITSPIAENVIAAAQLKTMSAYAEDANKYYKKAFKQQVAGAVANVGNAVYNIYSTRSGRETVAFENAQLDVQKQMINANVANTTANLMEDMIDATSQLQVISAAKNVDIKSQGVQSKIVAGGQELGEDIRDIQINSKLQKSAINYQKAANRLSQAQAEQNAIANFAAQTAGTAINFL